MLEKRSSDGNALPLAAGKRATSFAALRLPALRKALDDLRYPGKVSDRAKLLLRSIWVRHKDVVSQRVVKEVDVLENEGHPSEKILCRHIADVCAADPDRSVVDVVKTRD